MQWLFDILRRRRSRILRRRRRAAKLGRAVIETERDWLDSDDPVALLEYARHRTTDRKLRLIGVACVRNAWEKLTDERSRLAIDAAELYADGLIDAEQLAPFGEAAWDVRDELWDRGVAGECVWDQVRLAQAAGKTASMSEWNRAFHSESPLGSDLFGMLTDAHCHLIREIVGNPFRPTSIDESCRSAALVDLARSIYQGREFDRLPRLAERLPTHDPECVELAAHFNTHRPHVRGCWALDLILGL